MKWPEDLFLRFFCSVKCGKDYPNKKIMEHPDSPFLLLYRVIFIMKYYQ